MADWQPIETAPKDGTWILICKATDADGNPIVDSFGLFVQRAAWWEGDNEWIVYCGIVRDPGCFFEPTHWMPVPPPPVSGVASALPERRRLPERDGSTYFRALGWDECLDEIARRNGGVGEVDRG